jgi:hypothetical protein
VSKKIAIVQSNYIPWKGYFDLINLVDEFILFGDMQFRGPTEEIVDMLSVFRLVSWQHVRCQSSVSGELSIMHNSGDSNERLIYWLHATS